MSLRYVALLDEYNFEQLKLTKNGKSHTLSIFVACTCFYIAFKKWKKNVHPAGSPTLKSASENTTLKHYETIFYWIPKW